MILTGDSWLPLAAGASTAAFFLFLTAKLFVPAALGGVIALAAIMNWLWATDRAALDAKVDIGDGLRLPLYVAGPLSHSWWGTIVLILVDATVFASLLFSFFYLWTVTPGAWPPSPHRLPEGMWTVLSAALWLSSSGAIGWGRRALEKSRTAAFSAALLVAVALMFAAIGTQLYGQWQTGLGPKAHAYGAVVYAAIAYQALHVVVLLVMVLYTLARASRGLLSRERRVTFDNTRLMWHYMAGQGIAALLAIEVLPRFLG